MEIVGVSLQPSEHRLNCFDHESKLNTRWQASIKVVNRNYDGEDPYEEPHRWCYLHFTAYGVPEGDTVAAYKYLIKGMKVLARCYELDHGEQASYSVYAHFEVDTCHNTEGFHLFSREFYPIPSYGQPISSILDMVERVQYIYYSSLKLLNYGMEESNVGIAFECVQDMTDFLDNPPPLVADNPPLRW